MIGDHTVSASFQIPETFYLGSQSVRISKSLERTWTWKLLQKMLSFNLAVITLEAMGAFNKTILLNNLTDPENDSKVNCNSN